MLKYSGLDYMTSVPRRDLYTNYYPRSITNEEDLYYFQKSIGEGLPETYFGDNLFLEEALHKPKIRKKTKTIIRK